METLLEEIMPFITLGLSRGVFIFVGSLANVYLWGRMLGFLKTYRQKNFVGVLTMVPLTHIVIKYFSTPWDYLVSFIVFMSFSILLYVWIGFKAYERVDKLLDKKVGED